MWCVGAVCVWALSPTSPPPDSPPPDRPKFRSFFLPATIFIFLPLLGVDFVNFGEGRDPQNVHRLEFSGCRVKPPAAQQSRVPPFGAPTLRAPTLLASNFLGLAPRIRASLLLL